MSSLNVDPAADGFPTCFFPDGPINLAIQIAKSPGNVVVLTDVQGQFVWKVFVSSIIFYIFNLNCVHFNFLVFTIEYSIFYK
jgi:hypothetical protein